MEWILFVVGVIFGSAAAAIVLLVKKDKPIGTLRVDRSDPEDDPYLFLELKSNPDYIINKKRVTFIVKAENFISQK